MAGMKSTDIQSSAVLSNISLANVSSTSVLANILANATQSVPTDEIIPFADQNITFDIPNSDAAKITITNKIKDSVIFESRIFLSPPTNNDFTTIKSVYGYGNINKFLLNDVNAIKDYNASIKENDLNLNYNKFTLKNDQTLFFDAQSPPSIVGDFKTFINKSFEHFYQDLQNDKNNMNYAEKFIRFYNFLQLPSDMKIYKKTVESLVKMNKDSIIFPVGFLINKFNNNITPIDFQPTIEKYFIQINNIFQKKFSVSEEEIIKENFIDIFDNQIVNSGKYTYAIQKIIAYVTYSKFAEQPEIGFEVQTISQQQSSYLAIPPHKPNVEIKNYKYVNNKLLILMNADMSKGDVTKANYLDVFSQEQINNFEKLIKLKGLSYYSKNLIYSQSTVDENYFLIYRTETKPESYEDIVNNQNIVKKLNITLLETAFEDKIKANKKYYYCFQVENINGSRSDVTLVYEVEMIDQSGTVYLTQNVFKPEKKTLFIKQKDFENKVRIFPTDAQINIPEKLQPQYELIFEKSKTKEFLKDYLNMIADLENSLGYIIPHQKKDSTEEQVYSGKPKQTLPIDVIKLIEYGTLDPSDNQPFSDVIYLYNEEGVINKIQKSFQNFLKNSFSNYTTEEDKQTKIWRQIQEKDYLTKIGQVEKQIEDLLEVIKKSLLFFPQDFKDFRKTEGVFNNLASYYGLKYIIIFNKHLNILKDISLQEKITPSNSVFSNYKVFKIRVQSKNSKKKFDVNITYNLQVAEGIVLKSSSGITKDFEILKTELKEQQAISK